MQTDEQTVTTNLIFAFRNFAKVPKNEMWTFALNYSRIKLKLLSINQP